MKRRNFFRSLAVGGITAAISPIIKAAAPQEVIIGKPETNIQEALAIPRTPHSMPGKYPGKVVKAHHPNSVADGRPSDTVAYEMVKSSLLALTGCNTLKEAWLQFVGTDDIVGLKVNPIGGKLLSTSHAVTKAVIAQLEEAGLKRSQLIIWDRREESLHEAGFTAENYPGIEFGVPSARTIRGALWMPKGSFTAKAASTNLPPSWPI